jgi:hypothetical protein
MMQKPQTIDDLSEIKIVQYAIPIEEIFVKFKLTPMHKNSTRGRL